MNNTTINTTTWSTSTLGKDTSSSQVNPHVILQVLFSIIAVMAFCGNGFLCVVILQHRRFLRSSYNLLIFSLALTDLLTGKYITGTSDHTWRVWYVLLTLNQKLASLLLEQNMDYIKIWSRNLCCLELDELIKKYVHPRCLQVNLIKKKEVKDQIKE